MWLCVSLLDMSARWVGSTEMDGRPVGFGTLTYSSGSTFTGERRGGWQCGHWVYVYDSDGDVKDVVFGDDGELISSVFRVSDTHQTTTTITTTL